SDPTLRAGYPMKLGAGGETPLRYADLDGDNVPELIVPTEDGVIRVLRKDGSALAGFPVQTLLQVQAGAHLTSPALTQLASATPPREEPRAVVVADLDGDGKPELITVAGVHVYVWENDGTQRAGFPQSMNLANCRGADQKQPTVHRKCGFIGSPAIAHLEGKTAAPDIVVAGMDGHLYAWRPDGTSVAHFPVNLVDPGQPSDQQISAESINNPAIGDLNGDGKDDVVIATNETYDVESPGPGDTQAGPGGVLIAAIAQAAGSSSRVYAIDGATGDFLPGWPIHLNGALQTTLPLIGPGHDAALAKLDGAQAIVVSTTSGNLSIYDVSGTLVTPMN